MLTKRKLILDLVWQVDSRVIFSYDPNEDGNPFFWGFEADTWEDMGRPETITVTIEPGDLLNA